MPSTPRVDGVARTIRGMQKMKSHDGRNLKKGIVSCLNVILRRAQYLVPKDTRALELSGRTEVHDGVGLNVEGSVIFGGPAAPHAFVVHERPARHAPPTRSHYLLAAVNDTRGTCVSTLRRQMRVRDTSPADPGR